MSQIKDKKGVGLVEVIIGIAIIVGSVLASFLYFSLANRIAKQSAETVQGALLVEEGMEAVRVLRDRGFSEQIDSLSEDTDYYLFFSDGTWNATTTAQAVGSIFIRTFRLEGVMRDGNDDIVVSGGSVDPDTKEVTVNVSWSDEAGDTKTLEASAYITNAFEE